MGLGEIDHLLPAQEDHLPVRDAGRLNPVTGVRHDLLLLHGHLQHPAQRAVVAVHRARGQSGGDLVVEPVLDLVCGQAADPVRTEAGQHVLGDVPLVGLLGER